MAGLLDFFRPKPSVRSTEIVKVTPSGPPVGYVTRPTRRQVREQHPLIGADVNRIAAAFLSAFRGQPQILRDLEDDARDRDSRLDAICRTRVLAIQSRRWSIKPLNDDDKEGKVLAQRATRIIREIPGWRTRVGEFADGILRGTSLSELEWFINLRAEVAINGIHWVHPNRIRLDDGMRMQICEPGNGSSTGTPLESFGPDKFVLHSPNAGRAAYITRRGVLLSCMLPALTKRYGLKWWLSAAERFGQPAPVIRVPDGSDDAIVEKAEEMLRQLTADWQAVLSKGMELDAVAGSTGQFTGEVQARLVELVNTDYAIQILGQNLTTETKGGSFAAAQVQDYVRQDILAADLSELDDTITAQILEPIVRYNWPGAGPLVYETEVTAKASKEIYAYHIQAGVVTPDEVRAGLGLEALPNGEGAKLIQPVVTGTQPAAPALPPGGAATALPLSQDKANEMATEMTARGQTSLTSTSSTHPLERALKQRWGVRAQ